MKYATKRLLEKKGIFVAEFDRKVLCKYNSSVSCIRLYRGNCECFGFLPNMRQFEEKHELKIAFCSLFPGIKKVQVMDVLEEIDFKVKDLRFE